MKLKHYLVVVAFLCYYSYCYSEIVNTKSDNAAKLALQWAMTDVVPNYTGLTINSVTYKYTAVKNTADSLVVAVQNTNAISGGYIFRSQDDWTGLAGNTITKTVVASPYALQYWGPGQILLTGRGQIKDPAVTYGYRYDTCNAVPITDSACAGYKPSSQVKPQDTSFNVLDNAAAFTDNPYETEAQAENNRKYLLLHQDVKPTRSNSRDSVSILAQLGATQAAALLALNNIPEFKLYNVAMPGGVYVETIKYADKVLPDSRNLLRFNQSQQRLHNTMVESQYNR